MRNVAVKLLLILLAAPLARAGLPSLASLLDSLSTGAQDARPYQQRVLLRSKHDLDAASSSDEQHAVSLSRSLQHLDSHAAAQLQVDTHASATASAGRSLHSSNSSAVRPKIYIYNVSEAFRDNHEAYVWINTSLYGLEMTFPNYLMDSPYWTTNPEEADYFYVWAWLYSSRLRDVDKLLAELKTMPYWERKGGRDHIFTIVHDQGLCDFSHGTFKHFRPDLNNCIIIEHWGKVTGVYSDNPCHLVDNWAKDCDQVFKMVEQQQKTKAGEPEPAPCYTPGKDLLVPTVTSEKPETTRYLEPSLAVLKQDTLIVFGGGINQTHLTDPERPESDAGYSWGVRQTFARLYHNHPEVKIFWKMVPDYWQQFHKSIFCLAPAGWGWGARVKSAITRGCIPVIIQDGIKVEWEDELPMHQFAIRMPFMHLHRLPEILHRFKRSGRVEGMQHALACVWRLYWWTRPHGRAFEMTMCTLKSRLLGQKLELDLHTCTLRCGDSKVVHFNDAMNSV